VIWQLMQNRPFHAFIDGFRNPSHEMTLPEAKGKRDS
jgi:hypothetical protein